MPDDFVGHAWPTAEPVRYDPRLRFRLFVGGQLIDQVWLNADNPADHDRIDEVRDRHDALSVQADADGLPWMVEVYDPALHDREAYLRFGTDTDGMVQPL